MSAVLESLSEMESVPGWKQPSVLFSPESVRGGQPVLPLEPESPTMLFSPG
ncbi:hypothetical protein FACS189493_3140 [Spirochaetia bacterium]|nr:hypothetical protein FACS189493_3140 [Spirochaetia bacterium]